MMEGVFEAERSPQLKKVLLALFLQRFSYRVSLKESWRYLV